MAVQKLAQWLLFVVISSVGYALFGADKISAGGVMFLAALMYLWLPIKHPCDYRSYKTWWRDRHNWLSK